MAATIKGNNKSAANGNKPQAKGFLNLYAKGKNGGRRKLGVIFLMEADANQNSLNDWLVKDPAGNAARLNELVEFEFNVNTPNEGLDLPE